MLGKAGNLFKRNHEASVHKPPKVPKQRGVLQRGWDKLRGRKVEKESFSSPQIAPDSTQRLESEHPLTGRSITLKPIVEAIHSTQTNQDVPLGSLMGPVILTPQAISSKIVLPMAEAVPPMTEDAQSVAESSHSEGSERSDLTDFDALDDEANWDEYIDEHVLPDIKKPKVKKFERFVAWIAKKQFYKLFSDSGENNDLKQEEETIDAELQVLGKQKNTLIARKKELNSVAGPLDKSIQAGMKNQESLSRSISEFNQSLKSTEQEFDDKTQEMITKSIGELKSLYLEIEELKEVIKNESTEKDGELNSRARKAEKKIISLDKKITKIKSEVERKTQKIDESKQTALQKITGELNAKQSAMNENALELQKNTQHAFAVRETVDKNHRDLETLSDVEKTLQGAKEKIHERMGEVKTAQSALAIQLVSLIFNLRSIHQREVAIKPITIPKLIVGDPPVELRDISLKPTSIETRTDKDGNHYADIQFKKTRAHIKASIDAAETADVAVEIDDFTLTIGGEIATSLERYLNSKGTTSSVFSLGKKIKETYDAIKGKGGIAPIHLSANFGHVKATATDMKPETIVRAIGMAKRTPGNILHKALAGLPLPVTAHANKISVETKGELQTEVELENIDITLKPDVSSKSVQRVRHAALEVDAAKAKVSFDGPVKMINKLVGQLEPDNPLTHLPEPFKFISTPSALTGLPESASRKLTLDSRKLHIDIVREAHNRPTKASKDPVWFVEGDGRSHVTAATLDVVNHGDLEVDGRLVNLDLDIKSENGSSRLTFELGNEDNPDMETCHAKVTCSPQLIPALEKTTGIKKLGQLRARGKAELKLVGKNKLDVDMNTGAVKLDVSKLSADTETPVIFQAGDVRVLLPKSLNKKAEGLTLTTTKKPLDGGFTQSRLDVQLSHIELTGDGDIVVETGLDQSDDPESVSHKSFRVPVYGHGEVNNTGISTITEAHENGLRPRTAVMLHPRNIALRDIKSGDMTLNNIELVLDAELTGKAQIKGASISFDNLLNDQVSLHDEERIEIREAPRLPKIVKILLRKKTLELDGQIAVKEGRFNIHDLAKVKIKVRSDRDVARRKIERELQRLEYLPSIDQTSAVNGQIKIFQAQLQRMPKTSLVDRMTLGAINIGLRTASWIMKGQLIRVGSHDGLPVIRSRLIGSLPVPISKKALEFVGMSSDGEVNIPAAQSIHSGVYCFPGSVERRLNKVLDGVRSGEVAKLEGLKNAVSDCLKIPAKVPEALYLLKMCPIEAFTTDTSKPIVAGAVNQLIKIAKLAETRSETIQVALSIYNELSRLEKPVDNEVIERLGRIVISSELDPTELGECHYHLGNIATAIQHLTKAVDEKPKNGRALKLLAQALWEGGEKEQALKNFEAAAIAGEKGIINDLALLVNKEKNQEANSQARLVLGAMRLHKEVMNHDSEELKNGIHDLEVAVTDKQYAGHARELLLQRCEWAWKVQENQDVEEWQLWKKKVDDTFKSIKTQKRHKVSDEDLYDIGLSLMYSFRGINQNLDAAEKIFQAVRNPRPAQSEHINVLREIKQRRLQATKEAA